MAVLLSAVALAVFGANQHGLDAALMLTGRWAFLLFWCAYAGGGLAALLGGRFDALRRYGREFGLAFAATMLVHVGLIALLCAIGNAPGTGVFVFFGIGLVCTYTLAAFSLAGLQRRLGRKSWWLLRTVAMTYIAYAFATDFVHDPFAGGLRHTLLYAPFALMSLAGFAAYAAAQALAARKALTTT